MARSTVQRTVEARSPRPATAGEQIQPEGAPIAPEADGAPAAADAEVLETIKDVHARADGYTLDPHSAIGVAAARRVRPAGSTVPMVCLACAHWAKFPDANQLALGAEKASALKVPPVLASLDQLDTRVAPLPYDVAGVQAFIKKTLAERAS